VNGLPVITSTFMPIRVWKSEMPTTKRERRKAIIVARRRGLPVPKFGRYERYFLFADGKVYMHPHTFALFLTDAQKTEAP
jgi:hypothetical protein